MNFVIPPSSLLSKRDSHRRILFQRGKKRDNARVNSCERPKSRARMAKILVIDDTLDTLNLIRIKLSKAGHQVLTATDGETGLQLALQKKPQIVVLDVMLPKMDGFSVARQIRKAFSRKYVAILMLTARGQISDKVTGFEAGADDYLTKPFDLEELDLRIRTLLARSAPSPESDSSGGTCRLISVFSLRGGVGKTSLAVNLAVTLAQLWNEPIPLFDLSLQNGHAAIFLGLHPRATLDDLIEHWQEYTDLDALDEFFTEKPNLVRLLAAPKYPASAERVSAEMLKHLVKLVRSQSSFLIADLASKLDNAMLAVLQSSDVILLLMAPEVASVHSAVEALDALRALDYPKERVCLVLNQTISRRGLSPGQVETAVGSSIGLVIPHEQEICAHAINAGQPFVLLSPNSSASRAIQDYAYSLGPPQIFQDAGLTPFARTVRARAKGRPQ